MPLRREKVLVLNIQVRPRYLGVWVLDGDAMTATFAAVLLVIVPGSEPALNQLKLLFTFRNEFVAITPGTGNFPKTFRMGQPDGAPSTRPPHQVAFDYCFEVAKYEVPQNLWHAVMGSEPSRWEGPRNSVERVSFLEAREFCSRVTRLLREAQLIQAGEVVRLPSEAEWEYCCRAGSTADYSFGNNIRQLDLYGWHTGNAARNDPPVGAKQPNPWGLYDVHGYLWEWCSDHWQPNYETATVDGSPVRTGDGKRRVVRGGSWKDAADQLTSAARRGHRQDHKDDAVGFRCVLAKN